jgi:hypothetical protein
MATRQARDCKVEVQARLSAPMHATKKPARRRTDLSGTLDWACVCFEPQVHRRMDMGRAEAQARREAAAQQGQK